MPDFSGKLVAFLQNGDLVLALVTSQSGSKLQVTDANGRQHRVHDKHLLTIFDKTPADLGSLSGVVADLNHRIRELQDNIDTDLLWEFVRDECDDCKLTLLCNNYFGEALPLHQAAMYLTVCEDPIHFKVKGQIIQPRSPTQVAEQQLAQQRQQERRQERDQVLDWMRGVLNGKQGNSEEPDDLQLIRRLEEFLFRQHDDGIGRFLAQLDGDLPPREAAFEILSRLDRLPEDANPLLIISGIEQEFTPELLAAAEAIAPYTSDPFRSTPNATVTFSIDDDETREVDDALSVETDAEYVHVGIHIADAAYFLQKDDQLDREARRRSATIYLPTDTVTMLPERISCNLASLHAGELRPCVSYRATFTHSGELRDWSISRGEISVTHRLSYDRVDALLLDKRGEEPASQLQQLLVIANALFKQRRKNGAITIARPDIKVRVDADGVVHVKKLAVDTPSHRVVSELMILANRLTAEFGIREELPMIYRAQDPPDVTIEIPDEYEPIATENLFRHLKRGRLSVHPQFHAGLGLNAYTQASSPLRRFTDLVLQRQIASCLAEQRPPYQGDQLLAVLGAVEAAEQENRAYERQSTQFYLLRHIEQLPRTARHPVTIIRVVPGGYTVELDDYLVRARLWDNRKHTPGNRIEVKVHDVDARGGNLVVKPL